MDYPFDYFPKASHCGLNDSADDSGYILRRMCFHANGYIRGYVRSQQLGQYEEVSVHQRTIRSTEGGIRGRRGDCCILNSAKTSASIIVTHQITLTALNDDRFPTFSSCSPKLFFPVGFELRILHGDLSSVVPESIVCQMVKFLSFSLQYYQHGMSEASFEAAFASVEETLCHYRSL